MCLGRFGIQWGLGPPIICHHEMASGLTTPRLRKSAFAFILRISVAYRGA
jgi:hypothetical protein